MGFVCTAGRVPHTMRSAVIGLPPYRVFTIDEIEDATNNFEPENLVREETQGQVKDPMIAV